MHRRRGLPSRTPRLYAAALGFLLAANKTQAQTPADGGIGGHLESAPGRPAVGAAITARSIDTGLELRTVSDSHGNFLLVRLPAGDYRLTVATPVGEQMVEESVEVSPGAVAEVAAEIFGKSRLLVAAGQSGIPDAPDSLEASGFDTADSSVRGIDPDQNSRRTDGVSADESFTGEPLGQGVEEDGGAAGDTERDPTSGPGSGWRSVEDGGRRAGAAFTFASPAVREFRVGQSDAAVYGSALYGHGAGGVITETTRSGGTALHGMGFYTARNSAWAAMDPFAIASTYSNGVVSSTAVKPSDLRQQFGGRVGGPVPAQPLGGRLFYLYAADLERRSFPAISTPGYAGFYSLSPTQTALLANRGVRAAQTTAALNYLSSLTGTVPRRADTTVNFARLDWQHSAGDRLVLEYNRARWNNPAGARSTPVVDRGIASIGSSYGKVDMGVARWIRFLTPALSHELRLQYGRELQYEAPQAPLAQEPAVGPGGLPPEISIGPSGLVFGTPAALGRKAYPDEQRLELAEVLVWVRGHHVIQAGADLSFLHDVAASVTNTEGTFSYDSGTTNGRAGGLVDWITDYTYNVHAYPNGACPSIYAATHYFCFRSYSQSFGSLGADFHQQEWAGFIEDDWRASATLTVHAGLRYEYALLPLPQRPNAALDSVFGARGATSIFPEDRNNLGPRIGVAWQPFGKGKGVVRAGYGVYFGRLPGATVQAALLDTATTGAVSRVRILPTTETVCPQAANVGFGYACSYLAEPAGAVAATTSAVVFDRHFRLPMVQQASLSIERPVGAGILARAQYVTNLDRQLPNSVDLNIAPSSAQRVFQLQGGLGIPGVRDGETFAMPVYTARLSPSFGPVTDLVSNVNATYHGLILEARRGFLGPRSSADGAVRGLEFHASWTWSKAIDFGQSLGAVPRQSGQTDPFDVRYDKGLSALNAPHRITGSVVWTPWPTRGTGTRLAGNLVVASLARGWTVAAITSESSGRPYSYRIFGGTRLTGGHESINGSGGSTVLPTVGRNTLRLPDFSNADLRLTRSFHAGGHVRLSAAAEAFNVANHVNVAGVEQRAFLVGTAVNGVTPLVFQDAATVAAEGLNVQPFGTPTSLGSVARERQVQFTLRAEF